MPASTDIPTSIRTKNDVDALINSELSNTQKIEILAKFASDSIDETNKTNSIIQGMMRSIATLKKNPITIKQAH